MHKDRKSYSFGENKKNGYSLTKQIFELAKTYPNSIRPGHIALYIWICELNNRLGWDHKVIGIPTIESMKMIGMRDRRFYRRVLTELDDLGLIRIVKLSPNQYVATQVEILLNESNLNSNADRATSSEHDDSRYKYNTRNENAPFRGDDDSPPMEPLPDDDD